MNKIRTTARAAVVVGAHDNCGADITSDAAAQAS